MSDTDDGLGEAIEGQIRMAVAVAAQVGQVIAQQREQQLRRAQQAHEREARELQQRFTAERAAARAELAHLDQPQWWEHATPEKIGRSYEVARAWAPHDAELARAELRMRDELAKRYGVDATSTGAEPGAVQAAVQARLDEVDPERAQRAAAQADAGDRAEAAQLMAAANVDEARAAAAKAAAENEQRPEPEPLRPGQDRPESPAQGQEWTIEDQERQAAERKARAEHVAADADRAAHRQQDRDAEHEERRAADEANVEQSDTLDVTEAEADVDEPTQDEAPAAEKAQDGAAAESQDRADELREDAANSYDSAERREATAHELESKGLDHELVATRMRADVSQGRPATEAVKPAARPAKARKGRLRGLMGGRQRNLGR